MVPALPILALGVLAVEFFSVPVPAQKSGTEAAARSGTDWKAAVEKAHKHRRLMLRRAASRRVAAAGDAAIAAIRLDLVTAYGRVDSRGPATLALLEEWARDHDFFWRSQALEALANRRLVRFEKLFRSRLTDAAYLTRIQGGRGLCLLGVDRDRVLALLRDADPRVRLRIATCLIEEKDDRGLPALVEALRQEAGFLDYAWGKVGAHAAFKVLRKLAGDEFGYTIADPVTKNSESIGRFEAFARKRLGDRWVDPVPAYRDTTTYRGGTSIRSCRNGDLFVRFTNDRQVVFGLEARAKIELPEDEWTKLWHNPPGEGMRVRGRVICDYLRVMCKNPAVDEKFSPGAMPEKSTDWLLAFAVAIEKNGRQDLAKQIQSRLPQFSVRRIP